MSKIHFLLKLSDTETLTNKALMCQIKEKLTKVHKSNKILFGYTNSYFLNKYDFVEIQHVMKLIFKFHGFSSIEVQDHESTKSYHHLSVHNKDLIV